MKTFLNNLQIEINIYGFSFIYLFEQFPFEKLFFKINKKYYSFKLIKIKINQIKIMYYKKSNKK